MRSPHTRSLIGRRAWLIAIGIASLAALVFVLVFGTVRPAPPRQVTLLTGADGGAYRFYGERYREAFAAQGIELRLIATSGAVENLRRIKTDPDVDLAFIQAGLASEPESTDLVQLGSMFPEPVWIFHREGRESGQLTALAGERVAVGAPGSGTLLTAMQMLSANGFDIASSRLLQLESHAAAAGLRDGSVGAAIFVAGSAAPAVRDLLADPQMRLFSLRHVEAYRKHFNHLQALHLPAGALDLASLRPEQNIDLLGTSALLVAKSELHPAIMSLLLQIAKSVHGGAGLFQERGEYPSIRDDGLPVAAQARRFYDSGPPLLQRYLPFWLAVILDRLLVALLPTLALLIPLARIAPPLYAWRMRSRVYRWYGELKFLENQLRSGKAVDRPALLARLDEIEEAANRGRVPLSFANELYTLREHVGLVRAAILREPAAAGEALSDRTSA